MNAGPPMPRKIIFTDDQIAEMVSLYVSTSMSTRDIAVKFGVAYNTINATLATHGVTFDSRAKIAAKSLGRPSPMKGKSHSYHARCKIADAKRGVPTKLKGITFSDERKTNIANGIRRYLKSNPRPKNTAKRITAKTTVYYARNRCKNLLRRVLTLTGKKKATKTYAALGYTEKELIARIESQFKSGMSWELRESFHIDHIIPIAWFAQRGITDPAIINALDNLRPLYPTENRKKSDKYLPGIV